MADPIVPVEQRAEQLFLSQIPTCNRNAVVLDTNGLYISPRDGRTCSGWKFRTVPFTIHLLSLTGQRQRWRAQKNIAIQIVLQLQAQKTLFLHDFCPPHCSSARADTPLTIPTAGPRWHQPTRPCLHIQAASPPEALSPTGSPSHPCATVGPTKITLWNHLPNSGSAQESLP